MSQQKLISLLNTSFETSPDISLSVSYETKIIGTFDETTLRLFGCLQAAYNYFKQYIFNQSLSPVVLALNRNTKSGGYYMPTAWVNESRIILPEINISPKSLQFPAIEVMAILVHEMMHHFQYIHGKPSRIGYHNKQFSLLMSAIGLKCSTTGKPGGRETGQQMSHYIIEGGKFQATFQKMPKEFILPFKDFAPLKQVSLIAKKKLKIKYLCQHCKVCVWGKGAINLICEDCGSKLIEL